MNRGNAMALAVKRCKKRISRSVVSREREGGRVEGSIPHYFPECMHYYSFLFTISGRQMKTHRNKQTDKVDSIFLCSFSARRPPPLLFGAPSLLYPCSSYINTNTTNRQTHSLLAVGYASETRRHALYCLEIIENTIVPICKSWPVSRMVATQIISTDWSLHQCLLTVV